MALLTEKIAALKLQPPLSVPSGTSVREVIGRVQADDAGSVLVLDGGKLVGIMTERDVLMKVVARDVDPSTPVDQFMTPNPQTLSPTSTIGEAMALMSREGFRNVPIVDNGGAIGLIRINDIIDFLAESFPEQVINLPPRPHQKMTTAEGA